MSNISRNYFIAAAVGHGIHVTTLFQKYFTESAIGFKNLLLNSLQLRRSPCYTASWRFYVP